MVETLRFAVHVYNRARLGARAELSGVSAPLSEWILVAYFWPWSAKTTEPRGFTDRSYSVGLEFSLIYGLSLWNGIGVISTESCGV